MFNEEMIMLDGKLVPFLPGMERPADIRIVYEGEEGFGEQGPGCPLPADYIFVSQLKFIGYRENDSGINPEW